MTRALYFFRRRSTIVRCVSRHVSSGVLKKITPSPLERQSKAIHNPIAYFLIGLHSDDRFNFSPFLRINIMPEVEHTIKNDERYQVEYLEMPVKSENDKKEYR